MKKYANLFKAVGVILFVILILLGILIYRIGGRHNGYQKVEVGHTKAMVVDLMGTPSLVKPCGFIVYDGDDNRIGECFEISSYRGVFEEWAVAFDSDGKVIEKYYWFLGEYGNRPPVRIEFR